MTCNLADLSGVRAKLRRANEHLDALEAELVRKYDNSMFLPFEIRKDHGEFIIFAPPVPKLPLEWALILGDALHNLRSTLDYLAWQLVHRDGQEPTGSTAFPFLQTEKEFLDNVKARKKKPHKSPFYGIAIDGDAWTILEEAQPYKSPNPQFDILEALRRFSNVDKHHALHVGMQFPDTQAIMKSIKIGGPATVGVPQAPLSSEHPTPVLIIIPDDPTNARVDMNNKLPVEPTFGDSLKVGAMQIGFGGFRAMAARVAEILDLIAALPRVQD